MPPERQTILGKTIVLTGAAGGIGDRLARLLVERGADVVGIDRIASPSATTSRQVDLGDEAECAKLCESLSADPPDILINLAGVMSFGLHAAADPALIALCYRVNLVVPALLSQAVAGPMRARGSGRIVNIGSMLGAIPYPWFAVYSSSKAGLAALSQALRRELADSGVHVTHVAPRAARTPFNSGEVDRFLAVMGMSADDPEAVARRIADAICRGEDSVAIGRMERLYARINALAPRLIDAGLRRQIKLAHKQFP
ncbi:MAG: SDR family NAD(P)-dependent oxidoreductase [Pseudomonadota bacterium]|nr:SDR family NAD(P)-dependent oxidoreductase [Pseudomonadota bacterium]